jgi:hypothetical protein
MGSRPARRANGVRPRPEVRPKAALKDEGKHRARFMVRAMPRCIRVVHFPFPILRFGLRPQRAIGISVLFRSCASAFGLNVRSEGMQTGRAARAKQA